MNECYMPNGETIRVFEKVRKVIIEKPGGCYVF